MLDTDAHYLDRNALAGVSLVATYYGLPVRMLLSANRTRRVLDARSTAMLIVHQILQQNYSEIGRSLGGLDHSSVRNGIEQAQKRLEVDPSYAAEVERLTTQFRAAITEFQPILMAEKQCDATTRPLDVAKSVLRAPRGEIRLSGEEMRHLAEAYVDLLLERAEVTS